MMFLDLKIYYSFGDDVFIWIHFIEQFICYTGCSSFAIPQDRAPVSVFEDFVVGYIFFHSLDESYCLDMYRVDFFHITF